MRVREKIYDIITDIMWYIIWLGYFGGFLVGAPLWLLGYDDDKLVFHVFMLVVGLGVMILTTCVAFGTKGVPQKLVRAGMCLTGLVMLLFLFAGIPAWLLGLDTREDVSGLGMVSMMAGFIIQGVGVALGGKT